MSQPMQNPPVAKKSNSGKIIAGVLIFLFFIIFLWFFFDVPVLTITSANYFGVVGGTATGSLSCAVMGAGTVTTTVTILGSVSTKTGWSNSC